jgi:hypothetical protein
MESLLGAIYLLVHIKEGLEKSKIFLTMATLKKEKKKRGDKVLTNYDK